MLTNPIGQHLPTFLKEQVFTNKMWSDRYNSFSAASQLRAMCAGWTLRGRRRCGKSPAYANPKIAGSKQNDTQTFQVNKINSNNYTPRLFEAFKDDIYTFIDDIRSVKLDNLPEPFLPIHGANYGEIYPKIIFCGWETRNYHNLSAWVDDANKNLDHVIFWQEEFLNHEFVHWRSNFGADFWSFNLKFLAKAHNINDWRDFYRTPDKYIDILSSFVWANTDSIERFSVTAKKFGGDYTSWEKVKKASLRFDNFRRLLNTFEPDIVLIEHWDVAEEWIHQDVKYSKEEIIDEFLWHYVVEGTSCNVFWLPHPRGHNSKGVDSMKLINQIWNIL